MGILDRINEALEEAAREERIRQEQHTRKAGLDQTYGKRPRRSEVGYSEPGNIDPITKKPVSTSWKPKKSDLMTVSISGYPVVFPGINWDDVGLGLVRPLRFVPNKFVKLEYKTGKWFLTGARANSFVVYFLTAGGFGLIYFLQDLLNHIQDWGWFLSTAIVFIPMIINLFIKVGTLEFMPYEIEMLAYDRVNRTLVLSTLTEPGGVVALKLNLPTEKKLKEAEEARLIKSIRTVHSGFTSIDGLAAPNHAKFRTTSFIWISWLVIFALARYFY